MILKIHLTFHLFFHDSIHSTYTAWNEWQDEPIITTIGTTAYPIQNIDFPAITICSQGAAKDIMDKVLLRQFETYLRARGIKPQTVVTKSPVTTKAPVTQSSKGKRRKRSTDNPISGTLSPEKVWRVYHSTSILTLLFGILFLIF